MIYLTNDDETFIVGIVTKKSSKKYLKMFEDILEEKIYEAESDIYDEYEIDCDYDLLIFEKDFFQEEFLDLVNENTKIIII